MNINQLWYRRSKNASKCEGTIHRSRFSGEQTSFSFGPVNSGNNYNPGNAVQMMDQSVISTTDFCTTFIQITAYHKKERGSQRHTPEPVERSHMLSSAGSGE